MINLGTKAITAFTIVGFQFRDVGLDRKPGEAVTPAFGSDATEMEIYWRLHDGSVHGQTLDLANHVPTDADNDPVAIGIHDDHLSVTWAKVNQSWIKFSRIGNPTIYPMPEEPYYEGCHGPLLDHRLAIAAWKLRAKEALSRNPSATPDDNRCALDWYIVSSNRPWKEPEGQMARQLRAEWAAQIESYKKQRR